MARIFLAVLFIVVALGCAPQATTIVSDPSSSFASQPINLQEPDCVYVVAMLQSVPTGPKVASAWLTYQPVGQVSKSGEIRHDFHERNLNLIEDNLVVIKLTKEQSQELHDDEAALDFARKTLSSVPFPSPVKD